MDYGPRFSIENGGPVLFVVVGRVVANLQESFDRNQLALIEQVQVPGINRAGLDFLVSQRGVPEELGEPFIEPDRQASEIQSQQGMSVFMVQSVEWILPFRVQPQEDVIFVLSLLIDSGVTDVAFHFPLFR